MYFPTLKAMLTFATLIWLATLAASVSYTFNLQSAEYNLQDLPNMHIEASLSILRYSIDDSLFCAYNFYAMDMLDNERLVRILCDSVKKGGYKIEDEVELGMILNNVAHNDNISLSTSYVLKEIYYSIIFVSEKIRQNVSAFHNRRSTAQEYAHILTYMGMGFYMINGQKCANIIPIIAVNLQENIKATFKSYIDYFDRYLRSKIDHRVENYRIFYPDRIVIPILQDGNTMLTKNLYEEIDKYFGTINMTENKDQAIPFIFASFITLDNYFMYKLTSVLLESSNTYFHLKKFNSECGYGQECTDKSYDNLRIYKVTLFVFKLEENTDE